ncbi:MAG: ATP-dependent Clp protease ATP-binding subunit, partial [Anaerolineae bacterium]|nr:ATP-dependent Clp protease ATP-binding subunit [Anaerolineae bacterium]
MKFKFHLYVQKHHNQTYTVMPVPFYDLATFGSNLEEIKSELAEALTERIQDMSPQALQQLAFDPKLALRKVTVEVRPVDRKKRKKRREQVELTFSLLVKPEEDNQLVVTVPRLGDPPLTFYAYSPAELEDTARVEILGWLDESALEELQQYRHARSESLDTLEVDVELKKAKDRAKFELPPWLGGSSEDSFWALKEIGVNMTAQAAEGRFRRAYHRDDEVAAILQILMSPRHNSPLITGPAESGKTAVIHEVVRRIQQKDCDESLHDREVWLLTSDRIIAGAQFVGTWEERINNIVDECRKLRHILYVPDLAGLLEVGRWSKSDANVGMALKPHIASGEVSIIGETSAERLTMGENVGPSFITLFRRVEVAGLAEDETLSLLSSVARDLERDLNVRVLPDAIQASVQLSRRFWPYRAFPGKAVRLLEETTADITR